MLTNHMNDVLDLWVSRGFINVEQSDAIADLMEGVIESEITTDYDDGFETGWDEGYSQAQTEFEATRNEWFMQGWEEALIEHGIEE